MKEVEIKKLKPCTEALIFRQNFNSFEEAWNNCPRGDWMLWIAQRLNVNIHTLTYTKALCVETVLHLIKDERYISAVKVAKRFGEYKATKKELDAAAADAYAAADTAYAYAAAYAAAAADAAYAAAAYAAYAAAYAAYATVYAAYAAAYAAYAADAAEAAAKQNNQQKTAEICRKHLTKDVFRLIKKL